MKQKLLVIVGPTAVGKTGLSIALAKKFNGEIISADSAQVYKGLNIGSAKVTSEEMEGVRHHLISIIDPDKTFNAGDFTSLAKSAMSDIARRNKRPIVVGGTGMYISSLLFGLSVDCSRDEEYRKELEKFDSKTLHKMLAEIDPESASVIHENHKTRIIRALEIYHLTGKKKSSFSSNNESEYDYLLLCLTMERGALYERINKRVNIMLENGLLDEVKNLLESKRVEKTSQSMSAIGYKEAIAYLDGNLTYEEFVCKLKQNSRNYAKRQMTYFKKLHGVIMVDANDKEKIFEMVEKFYAKN